MLEVKDVTTCYGSIEGVSHVALEVSEGEIVALLGSNGAGKTTTLQTIAGLLRPVSGEVIFMGEDISGLPAEAVVRKGISYVPEGRGVFPEMTTMENIELGAYTQRDRKTTARYMKLVFAYFPILEKRKTQIAGTLSGGEQQMLAIGRGLMSRPKLILLDEPSLGLAPLVIRDIAGIITKLQADGTTLLLVEQNAYLALRLSSRAYVLEKGRIVLHGDSKDLLNNEHVKEAYLGGGEVI